MLCAYGTHCKIDRYNENRTSKIHMARRNCGFLARSLKEKKKESSKCLGRLVVDVTVIFDDDYLSL